MSSRKRKHATGQSKPVSADIAVDNQDPDPALFIQAHEADLIRGPQARNAAQSLEIVLDRDAGSQTGRAQWNIGDSLIRWGRAEVAAQETETSGVVFHDEDDHVQQGWRDKDEVGVWVDRYDARLLLDALPAIYSVPVEPPSPTGWSDLPSDSEDTFFFAPAEAEDYRREKRRRMIDRNREERLKAMRAEDDDGTEEEVEVWGDSDEEPDETQKELMRRTATHILSSPNYAQLEMRILANYGGDRRFAFLRGRWSRTWKMIKGRVKMDKEKEEKVEGAGAGLGGLAGYGDSEDEDRVDETTTSSPNRIPKSDEQSDDPVKEARRARAKAWAEKRRQKNG